MSKILTIARWEFLEKVKTKSFIISLVITPLIIIMFSILPTLLTQKEDLRTKLIGVVDTSGIYFYKLVDELEQYKLDNFQPNYILLNLADDKKSLKQLKIEADKDVTDSKIEGFLFILNGGTDSLRVEYRSEKLGGFRDVRNFEEKINKIRIQNELNARGIDPSIAEFVQSGVDIEQIKIEKSGKEGKQNFLVVFFSAFIFIMLLMMMVIYSGQLLVRSLIEEKSNRLIEILISSCTSEQLLAGKILGLSALGLTQIVIWSLIGITLVGGAVIPPAAFDNILIMLVYFITGFIFYTTIFVGIGSIVTTEQEAQQMTTYISLILILPVVVAMPAIQNPESLMVKVMSYIPLTIPSIMLLRFKIAPVPLIDIIITLSIMFVSTIVTLKIAAKIFRIGILSYGKKPTIKELIQWSKEE
ncbi:MAG: ABC transporter permease [Ignavibacteria bacterium]|nr:MAG: ABC transporter permease [Ignavibacteria bacterium]